MFKNLTNFAYKRNVKEAIGLYVAYLVFIVLSSILIAKLLGIASDANSYQFGFKVGNVTAIIVTLVVAFLILNSKKLLGNFTYILLALISGILAIYGGGLLGLIPVAYLSTRQANKI